MLFFFSICCTVIYDIFIYSNWASAWWQWSVNLYKNRKEVAVYKRRNNTQSNTEAQNTQSRKETHKTKRILKDIRT